MVITCIIGSQFLNATIEAKSNIYLVFSYVFCYIFTITEQLICLPHWYKINIFDHNGFHHIYYLLHKISGIHISVRIKNCFEYIFIYFSCRTLVHKMNMNLTKRKSNIWASMSSLCVWHSNRVFSGKSI